jgi:molybdenum cofactor cytidylyltransferase
MKSRPAVIVLAAGRGERFLGAAHKLGQPLGDTTVLGTTLRNAIASQLPVVVVTTERLADMARRSVAARDVIVVPDVTTATTATTEAGAGSAAHLGMGHSIASGVSARANAGGWLILPGDMPLVQPATLVAVAAALEHHPVVCAHHKGRRGHPVGFSSELYSELVMLSGDEGARRLVARYPALGLELDDPGVLVDVDTEADLAGVRLTLGEAPLEMR